MDQPPRSDHRREPDKSGAQTSGTGRSRWAYAALGSELAGSVLVPVLLGLWADRKFGWQPWGVVAGATLGMIAAGTTLARLVLRSNQQPDHDNTQPQ